MTTKSSKQATIRKNLVRAKQLWPGQIEKMQAEHLRALVDRYLLSVESGDLQLLNGHWYVNHTGLLRLAHRKGCVGIRVEPVREFCDPIAGRFAFKATVYNRNNSHGFVGYGDADPSNVSPLVRGAEMRVAETRAVNRALRKAYGIGICSVEEVGSLSARSKDEANVRKLPPQPANGNGEPKLRDQLCLLIRQHRLDASQVKQFAGEFCGTNDIRQASRGQIQSFITHLAEVATKDRDGLLCKLNSYGQKPESGVA
jgi:hypothetical protein